MVKATQLSVERQGCRPWNRGSVANVLFSATRPVARFCFYGLLSPGRALQTVTKSLSELRGRHSDHDKRRRTDRYHEQPPYRKKESPSQNDVGSGGRNQRVLLVERHGSDRYIVPVVPKLPRVCRVLHTDGGQGNTLHRSGIERRGVVQLDSRHIRRVERVIFEGLYDPYTARRI